VYDVEAVIWEIIKYSFLYQHL